MAEEEKKQDSNENSFRNKLGRAYADWREKRKDTSSEPKQSPPSSEPLGGAGRAIQAGISSASLLLIIGGLIRFIFLRGENYVGFIFSLVLFIIAGYALSEKLERGRMGLLIPMLGFVVWYFVYNGNYDPGFLLYFLLIFAAISSLLALFSKGESVRAELLGLVPAVFLFLDLGLLDFLILHLHLTVTPLLESLVLWMPWWSLLGLLTIPSRATERDRKSTRLNSSHSAKSRMPSSA